MTRPLNIKLMMDVYKGLVQNKCHTTVAENLSISPAHVGRIADFYVKEYFLVPESIKSHTKLYVKTKRVPTPKILFDIINFKKHHDGGHLSVVFITCSIEVI